MALDPIYTQKVRCVFMLAVFCIVVAEKRVAAVLAFILALAVGTAAALGLVNDIFA